MVDSLRPIRGIGEIDILKYINTESTYFLTPNLLIHITTIMPNYQVTCLQNDRRIKSIKDKEKDKSWHDIDEPMPEKVFIVLKRV